MEKESTKLRILPMNSSIVALEQARQCTCELWSSFSILHPGALGIYIPSDRFAIQLNIPSLGIIVAPTILMGFVFWVKAITHKLRKKDQTTQILAPAMNLQKKNGHRIIQLWQEIYTFNCSVVAYHIEYHNDLELELLDLDLQNNDCKTQEISFSDPWSLLAELIA